MGRPGCSGVFHVMNGEATACLSVLASDGMPRNITLNRLLLLVAHKCQKQSLLIPVFLLTTGCKIKALRAKTNTYIKTPVRGAEPVFVVTGRKEDVAQAKREIVSAAEHFSQIRASRRNGAPAPSSQGHSSGSSSPTSTPGHITIQVRVPYKVVGLVVGPKGATIKRIQQTTSTYIVTPGRDKEPVFEVTGLPDSVERAREEIEKHIASRTGTDNNSDLHIDDFQVNGIDSGFHDQSTDSNGPNFNGFPGVLNLHDNLPPLSSVTANNGHYSSGSTCNSTGAGLKISDYSNMPFSAFSTFDASDIDEGIGTSGPNIFDPAAIWGSDSSYHIQRSNSVSMSSRLPHSDEGPHPRTRRTNSDPLAAAFQRIEAAFSSSSPSSSQGSTSPVSGHRSPRSRGCLQCGGEVTAALVPCGHNSFCMSCAHNICQREDRRECPICHVSPTQAIMIHN